MIEIHVEKSYMDKHGNYIWCIVDTNTKTDLEFGWANTKREAWDFAKKAKDIFERKKINQDIK